MKYLYENHMGGLYTSDKKLDYNYLYCEQCGDSDRLLGTFTTIGEFWDLIRDKCSIDGCDGYSLQYIYPIMISEFNLPNDAKYENDYERDSGFCCDDDEEILTRIEELTMDHDILKIIDYMNNIDDNVDAYLKNHKLPSYFYLCFFGELIKMFGANIIIPNKDYLAEYDDDGNIISGNEDDYSYRNQLDYYFTILSGTGGWNLALKEACKQCNVMDFYQYYNAISWIESDLCDGYIVEEMLNVIFCDGAEDSYYKFKFNSKGETL